jgi:Tfp pilus assembly protein PilN
MPAKKEVSLLPDSENVNSFGSRFIRWITTAGRFVIVFTELIVISAFISRFWLDRKNADLSDVIRQQKAILASTQDFEKEYTLLEQRLKFVKDFYANRPSFTPQLNSLIESTPPDIVFQALSVDTDPETGKIAASLDLEAYKENSIIDFVTNLTVNPDIETVIVNNINKRPKENNYVIRINLVFADKSKT